MKAQTHYTTPITATPWMRWGMRALAGLLVLAVVIVGLVYALGLFGQPSQSRTNGGVGAPARTTITNCRVCRDEALAARQPGQALTGPVKATTPIRTPTGTLISSCRVCRDETLGANHADLITTALVVLHVEPSDPRQIGPR